MPELDKEEFCIQLYFGSTEIHYDLVCHPNTRQKLVCKLLFPKSTISDRGQNLTLSCCCLLETKPSLKAGKPLLRKRRQLLMLASIKEAQLIACVRRHPPLYDPSHPEYLLLARKAEVWNEIGETLGISADRCKLRWNSIRDGYRKSIRRNKMKAANGENTVPYKNDKKLLFLRPFLRASGEIEEEDVEVEVDINPKSEICSDEYEAESCSEPMEEVDEGQAMRWKGHDSRELPVDHASLGGYSEDLEPVQQPVRFARAAHPVDAFLECIGSMVKALPPYYQAMAKAEIFAAAHKYELLCIKESAGLPVVFEAGSEAEPAAPAQPPPREHPAAGRAGDGGAAGRD